MSDGGEEEEGQFELDLATFLNQYSGLFTVIGVFAALAVYLSRLTEGPIYEAEFYIQAGFIASFLISLIVIFEVFCVLKSRFGSWNELLHAHLRVENTDLFLFTLCIIIIALTIYQILAIQSSVFFALLIFVVMGVALAVMLRAPRALVELTPDSAFWRVTIGFTFSGGALAVSHFLFFELKRRFELTSIQELTFNDPVAIFALVGMSFFAMVRSLAAVGVIAVLLAIPLILFDKLRGIDRYG